MEELSLHVLDIVHNSIEAGATRIDVDLEENAADDRLRLRISDNGRGMDPQLLKQVFDPFVTSRQTRRVGLGLSFLAEVAEACNGQVSVESAPGLGTSVLAEFQASHIDLPPLGDLRATLLVIAASTGEVDFRYCHRARGRVFRFSTVEMRKSLGEVPIDHPLALRWVDAFITRGLQRLAQSAERHQVSRRRRSSTGGG